MKRVLIIGCPGAGKTTFSCRLAEITGLPLAHLDRLFWQGDWETVSREEFDARLAAVLAEPAWMIDGNYDRTLSLRLSQADTVFFFDLPTASCLWGVTKRVLTCRGQVRPDMGGHCVERFGKNTIELYRNVLSFRRQHRKAYRKLLAEAETEGKTIVTLRSRREADAYLQTLTDRKE